MVGFTFMNSTAEPALAHKVTMDNIYRLQRHIYDVTRRYFLLGRDTMLDGLALKAGDSVLEMGCGTGRNLVGVARRYPGAELFGLDISEEMLKSAQGNLLRAGLARQAKIACADATAFDPKICFGVTHFSRVYFSYTLSMIPDWRAALDAALNCVEPGGELHIVDFGQCEGLPKLLRNILFSWVGLFHVHPLRELRRVVAHRSAALGAEVTFHSLYRDYAWLIVVKTPRSVA
ncbi:MAG: class I SAM-dependent methyltransferase [Alphaproteobacteria bacterium]|nr:class I SAM-dependent methyltransferase [Alphaproteobacteria bacterium]